jgi:hypothetical protein
MLLAICFATPGFADSVDEDAILLLKKATSTLAGAEQLKVTTEFGFDVLQEDGQKLEFGARQEVTIQRPDKARVNFNRRDGVHGGILFDGKRIAIFNPDEKVYAIEPFEGDIDHAFNHLTSELGIPMPLNDFFSSDPSTTLAAKLDSGYVVGESTVAEVLCDHLALRNDEVDFQVWIARGEKPLPRRVVITYKNEKGQPQFWAQFIDWDLTPKITGKTFAFDPPEDSEEIPFAVVEPAVATEGGQP